MVENTGPARPDNARQTPAQDTVPSTPQRHRRKRWILIVVGLVIIALIAVAFLRPSHKQGSGNRRGAQAGNTAEPVAVTKVTTGDMPEILTELGTVVPITNVTVQARVNGYIMKVEFAEGQHVKAGDELVLIDPRPYQVALDQMLGTLQQDEAQLADARVNANRYATLIKQNSIAAMTAKDAEYKVQQLEGTVKLDQANVANARLNLYYCHVLAPVDGRVGIRAVDMGNYFTAGQSGGLTVLTQMQPISVIFTMPQDQLPQVTDRLRQVGELPVEAWDSSNLQKIATGTVKALDSQIDTATGTVRLRAIFSNEDEHLFPNQFVNAHLLVDTLHNVMLLPSNALQTGPDGQFVYVVKSDNTVEVHNVKTGIASNDTTVIQSGVTIGDRVVTDGTNHLRPGSKVTIPADENTQPTANDNNNNQHANHRRAKTNGQQSESASPSAPEGQPTPPASNHSQSGH
ncbi:efflux RND transporter periplasmic adaptor subunit [Kozakia baliensis]|uniref:efflux RND transporter periplasmic adaptor subunit n=1 Tax=Kozakia baliensis TaxID=153496 RepID=UPI00087A2170|nr:efflux RND transporter periplasmic adaptor subunit [Kozakia baliensis]AOX20234.1 multidrug transporter subunit MdtA [Kozakia baliensis]